MGDFESCAAGAAYKSSNNTRTPSAASGQVRRRNNQAQSDVTREIRVVSASGGWRGRAVCIAELIVITVGLLLLRECLY
ncbi:hypothetical protein J6590_022598 [Homalodisca vitripennis]|nr:hypothetical protein J6590_022598 [Homalodisca vitripennis]